MLTALLADFSQRNSTKRDNKGGKGGTELINLCSYTYIYTQSDLDDYSKKHAKIF
jgi:hypothetical protein